jgi:hypothetical protein
MATYQQGDVVIVTVYGGSCVRRRVWNDHGRGVDICSEADYQRAITQGVPPRIVGFPREDIEPATATIAPAPGAGSTEP